MVPESYRNTAAGRFNPRRLIGRETEKQHALLPGFFVVILQKTIGPDITVENKDLCVGIVFFDMQGVFDGCLAADPGAVGIFFVA